MKQCLNQRQPWVATCRIGAEHDLMESATGYYTVLNWADVSSPFKLQKGRIEMTLYIGLRRGKHNKLDHRSFGLSRESIGSLYSLERGRERLCSRYVQQEEQHVRKATKIEPHFVGIQKARESRMCPLRSPYSSGSRSI